MLPIARRHAHYVFAVLQSGLTTAIATGIASLSLAGNGRLLLHWLMAWATAWAVMLPVVVFAAPAIRRCALALTRDEAAAP